MIMRVGNARWKSLAPKKPPANARVARNERSCLKRGAFVSSSMSREMSPSEIGASPSSSRGTLVPGLSDDFFDLSEPGLRGARLGPFLPVPAFWDRPKRRREFFHSAFDAGREIRADFPFRHEAVQQLPRLVEVLRRLIPKSPVIREEFRDVSGVDGFVIGIRGGFHVVSEEEDDEVHEVLPRDLVNLEFFEDHVRDRDRGAVEFQPSPSGSLAEQHIVAKFELVEEDVDVETVLTFIVRQAAFPEEAVDHVVGSEA